MTLVVAAGAWPADTAWGEDRAASERGTTRLERRARDLALPDEYLDPQWPSTELDGSGVAPEESDSVENVPLDVERPDAAEQEELERYKEALGLEKKPDDFSQDNWGQTPRQTGAGEDEPRDPASW